jgi:carbonic anhydrase
MKLSTVLRYDVPASLVVFLVAVPLSLGIALASGSPIVAGLIAAIVGGVVAGALGGSAMQVSGPAAGLTVVMAQTITTFGWPATCAITVAAGALQILLGLSRIAWAALAISPAIVHGMLAGIGVTIVLSQLHVLLGGSPESSAIQNILAMPGQIMGHHDEAVLIGGLTVAILLVWPRLPAAVRKVPGPLAAIAFATAVSLVFGLRLDRVQLPGDLLNIDFAPRLPSGGWLAFGVAVVTIALIASVESLLSAVAVDKLHTGPRSDLNRELIGQGAANIASGALGGLPVTGVIVRGSTNVTAGAKTRVSAVLHGVWVLVLIVLLAGLIGNIPLAALAGLLVHVGAKLVNLHDIRQVFKHGDLAVYLVTLLGVVTLDLLTGVLSGIALSLAMTLRRTIWAGIHAEQDGEDWRVVIEGALTFLSVPRLSKVLATIPERTTVTLEMVVDYLDHAAFDSLSSWQQAHERSGGTVVVDEVGHPWFARGKSAAPTVSRGPSSRSVPRWLAPWFEWQAFDVQLPDQRVNALHRGASEFQRRTARLVQPTLSRLVDGQDPQTLFITCGDARIVPNLITTSGPGDSFAVRNIGNLVPAPHGPDTRADDSVGAAIEFAVGVLKVREVVVCGHSSCGAMKALMAAGSPDDMPALNNWLRHAEPSVRRRKAGGAITLEGRNPGASNPLSGHDQLALHNVLQQLEHLRRYRLVSDAEARGDLHLTGMYFDGGAAQVYLFDSATDSFTGIGVAQAVASES